MAGTKEGARKRRLPLNEHIKSNIKILKNGCWAWQGALNEKGYGAFKYNGKWTVGLTFASKEKFLQVFGCCISVIILVV